MADVGGSSLAAGVERHRQHEFTPHAAVVDIELTSRCNARCSFCPRDETPHQGLIHDATFAAALGRAVEYRDALVEFQRHGGRDVGTVQDTIWLSFCGMGEPLLHPRVVEYVARVADAGLKPIVNTNAALLTPEMAEDLMAAGLAMACINAGEIGERYEEVYGLPFERTRANVEHFLAAAPGRCIPVMVLVDHRGDPDHAAAMRRYWSDRGAGGIMDFALVNRAGSLASGGADHRDGSLRRRAEEALAEVGAAARCWVPFLYPFIGYDGNYYLCSSDWRKEVNLGSVVDRSLVDLFDQKADYVSTSTSICRGCTHEPTNALERSLAVAADPSTPDDRAEPGFTPERLLAGLEHYAACVAAMRTHMPRASGGPPPTTRRLIPVRS